MALRATEGDEKPFRTEPRPRGSGPGTSGPSVSTAVFQGSGTRYGAVGVCPYFGCGYAALRGRRFRLPRTHRLTVKILIRATNWIGDAIMSLPAIRAVRERYPDAELCILAHPWVAAVYEGEPSIDRILPLEGEPGFRDFGAKWRCAQN